MKINVLVCLSFICLSIGAIPNPAYWMNGIQLKRNENHPAYKKTETKEISQKKQEEINVGSIPAQPFFLVGHFMRKSTNDERWFPTGRIFLTNGALSSPEEWYVQLSIQAQDEPINNEEIVAFVEDQKLITDLFKIEPVTADNKPGIFVIKKIGDRNTFNDFYWRDFKAYKEHQEQKASRQTRNEISKITNNDTNSITEKNDSACEITSVSMLFTKTYMSWIFFLVFLILALWILWPRKRK